MSDPIAIMIANNRPIKTVTQADVMLAKQIRQQIGRELKLDKEFQYNPYATVDRVCQLEA